MALLLEKSEWSYPLPQGDLDFHHSAVCHHDLLDEQI
jgi:hypothetical protein